MFRNPRENITKTPGEYVAPSVGRPPSPPLAASEKPRVLHDHAPAPRPMMAAVSSTLPTIRRGSTTPRKGNSATNNKAKGKPNGSILSFFKKAEEENEELFVRTKDAAKRSESSPWFSKPAVEEQNGQRDRFQEDGIAVKRRKLEHTAIDPVEDGLSRGASRLPDDDVVAPETAAKRSTSARKPAGVFVEDDSDEEGEEPETQARLEDAEKTPVAITEDLPGADRETAQAEAIEIQDVTEQEKAPDPPSLTREQTSMTAGGDFADFEDLGDFDEDMFEEGDEFAERLFMEEQAQLEAEMDEVDLSNGTLESVPTEGLATECSEISDAPTCPICSISMAGVSDEQAGIHVNNCLDGNPTPLPQTAPVQAKVDLKSEMVEMKSEVPKAADRFRKIPRAPKPGQANPFVFGEKTAKAGSAFSKLMSGHAEDAAWADAAAAEKDSRGKPAYTRTCPFYKIMPGFNICVDAFRYGAVEGCKAYFLSHFHSDHYIGLTSHWSHGPIYCSKVTANLVKQQLRVDPQYVIALDWETKVEVPGTKGVDVTMISANHCPGSSLFLFEKVIGKGANPKLQRILHCGDFRACRAHIEHPLLRPDVLDAVSGKKKDQKIDICYLDSTYLTPRWAFPSQEKVIKACADMCVSLSKVRADASDGWETMKRERAGAGMVKFVKKESEEVAVKQEDPDAVAIKQEFQEDTEDAEDSKPNLDAMTVRRKANEKHRGRLLVVVGTYSIGKERICLGIARALKSKIFAPTGKRRIIKALEDPELSELMTDDPTEAQIHMTPLFEIRADTLDDYLKDYKDHFSRAVGFRPSGWNYKPPNSRFTDSPSVSTVLHSGNWKSDFSMKDLVPQRGSTSRASCFGVPYSEHSSFRELTMFCCALRIEKIIPTVNVGSAKSREKMKQWCEKWAMERKKNGLFKLQEGEEW